MNDTRFAGKVGLFVVIGALIIGGLMLNFSRGIGLFKPKYELLMRTKNVAGLKESSDVFFQGVKVGTVTSVRLDQATRSVVVRLEILEEYPLHADSKFMIEQVGFLGDQFVIIYPGSEGSAYLKDGDEVKGIEPFNLTEVARSTADLLKRFDQLGAVVGDAITRVNNQVLDSQTLSNLARTVGNFQQVSDRTLTVIDDVGLLVTNNGPAFTSSLSNMVTFTKRLEQLAIDLDETIVTNRQNLHASMQNLQEATASMKKVAADLEDGRGTVGGLLRDEQLRVQITSMVSNLTLLSSNLNRFGLLYKPKPPKDPKEPLYPGKSPFR